MTSDSRAPDEEEASRPLPATLAGRYVLRARVGAGGMGAIYKGFDALTSAAVAVKIASGARGARAEQLAREASVLSELRHPNLVAYQGFGITELGEAFLVMEWLEGEDLAARLARGPLDVPSVLALGAKVAGALAFVHARGIIHRDLKPSNIFLPGGDVERVKIIDLGVARADVAPSGPPEAAGVVGTPLYMAPEQARGDQRIGPPADLFSLGCTLYEGLTGKPPFGADHAFAVAAKILFEEPAPLRSTGRDIPEELEALVLKLLAKDPAQRPRSASEVAEAIARIDQPAASATPQSLTGRERSIRVVEDGASAARDELPRTLIGKATPCVGREREIATLIGLFEECLEEPAATAALVTGPAGVGKSRLRAELTRALGEREPGVEIWLARGDPMSKGAPFHLLAQALRRACGIGLADDPELRAQKLRERVERLELGHDEPRVIEFLAEIAMVPLPSPPSPRLALAREDPVLMADQLRRVFEDFVGAECEAHPVVIVLDDIHAGDLPSLKLVGAALKALASAPLFVLLLARSEIDRELVADLRARGVHEVRLGPLGKKACERLARSVLGPSVSEARLARLVDRSCGNAFFLEELIRVEAEGGRDLPDSVLAILQARLASLPEPERRLLRAASVFGETFTELGVLALLGLDIPRAPEIRAWIFDLIEREILSDRSKAGAPGEVEHAFRHGLLRDAAYATLLDDDRRVGHRLAGEHLLAIGATEAFVLAEHFEWGGEPGRAAGFYAQAAEEALGGDDLEGAVERAERGVACGAQGEELGALRLLQATAHNWRGAFVLGERSARAAFDLLRPGSARWYEACERLAWVAEWLGDGDRLDALRDALLPVTPLPGALKAALIAWAALAEKLFLLGRPGQAREVLARVERAWSADRTDDTKVAARIHFARALGAHAEGCLDDYLASMTAVVTCYEEAGDLRNAGHHRVNEATGFMELGLYAEATELLRRSLADAERLGIATTVAQARQELGVALSIRGSLAEARAELEAVALSFEESENLVCACIARSNLARALLRAGDLAGATEQAEAALRLGGGAGLPGGAGQPSVLSFARAVLAAARLAAGAPREAVEASTAALGLLRRAAGGAVGEAYTRLIHAEALFACGDREAGREALAEARARLLARASAIADPAFRESFLRSVPEHARTLDLSSAELDAGPAAAR